MKAFKYQRFFLSLFNTNISGKTLFTIIENDNLRVGYFKVHILQKFKGPVVE